MKSNSDAREFRSNIRINRLTKCCQDVEHGVRGPSITVKWCFSLTDYQQARKTTCPSAKYLPVQCPVLDSLTLCDAEIGIPGPD